MAIRTGTPPEPSQRAAADGIAQLLATHFRELTGGRAATQAVLTAPHQSYVLGLTDVARGRGIRAAVPTGWRFLVRDGDDYVALSETADSVGGESSRLSKVDPAPRADFIARALRSVEDIANSLGDDFEVRYLRVPALFLSSIWLHSGTRDLLFPLESGARAVEAAELVPADQLLGALAHEADALLEEDEETLGG